MVSFGVISRARFVVDTIREHRRLEHALEVGDDELVLDIGSGASPFPRANVLCDRYPDPSFHRHGTPIAADRPLVIGDVEALPFKDGAFDVVVCSHVLEHVADPAAAVAELQRVGRRGYVECPNAPWEKVGGFPFHRWLVSTEGDVLVFREKAAPIHDPELRDWFAAFQAEMGITQAVWLRRRRLGVYTELVWDGSLECRVERLPGASWEPGPGNSDTVGPSPGLDLFGRIIRLRGRAKRRVADRSIRDLGALLRCPACTAPVRNDPKGYRCEDCAREYPNDVRGWPRLLT